MAVLSSRNIFHCSEMNDFYNFFKKLQYYEFKYDIGSYFAPNIVIGLSAP